MKSSFSKRWTILPFMLMLLMVLSACQTATEAPAPESQTPEAVTNVQTDLVFGSGAFTLLDTEAGLASLPSYKASLTLTFDGTRAGQPSQWSKTYVMLTKKDPAARQLTLEKTGDLTDLDALFMAEVGEAAYERRGETACNANVIKAGDTLGERLEPAGFLNGVIGADEAGSETVNGVAANHYTFDERAFGQLEVAKSTGEMWVSSEGGYILRYLLTTKGNADYFGEGIEGTLTWDYELTGIDTPIAFELPADCPAGMLDVPLLPDATNVLSMPGMLTYDTASSIADTLTFHQEQVSSLGWTPVGEPTITETSALLIFTRDDQNLTVIVTTDSGVTTVTILLEKISE